MHSRAFRKCSLPDLCKTDLFYAEHMLRHFNAIGRQGAVIQQLNQSLPPTLHGLYRMMLAEYQRRTAANRQEAVAVLLRWILFSFRPLALDEVVSLIRHAGDDESFDLEEIPEAMSKFVQIGDPGEAFEVGQTSEIMYLITDDLPEPVYSDGQLPLMLRQRAMRSFFLDPSAAGSNLLTTPSEAHRRIFLAAVVFARPTPEGAVANVDPGLSKYATMFLADHWMGIRLEEHSPEERVEAMEALASVMSNEHGFASMVETCQVEYSKAFSGPVFERMSSWANWAAEEGLQLSPAAGKWWMRVRQNPSSSLLELAKAHSLAVYRAPGFVVASRSYTRARDVLLQVCPRPYSRSRGHRCHG